MKQTIQLLAKLVRDDRGSSAPIGMILVTTIVSLGAIVGLVAVRDHLVQQYGDASVALRELRQAYSFEVWIDVNRDSILGPEDCVLSGGFDDVVDLTDPPGAAPACLDLTISPIDESS